MQRRHRFLISCFTLIFASIAVGLSADVVLIFEPVPGNNIPVDPAYGDNVTSASENGFEYGDTDGIFAPNVTIEYGDTMTADLFHWSMDYGDLSNVLYEAVNGIAEIRIVAELGYKVELYSFDVAGWPTTNYTIASISVTDECNTTLFNESGFEVIGFLDGSPASSSLIFDEPLVGKTLAIRLDMSNLGGGSDNIGIDNIRFGQIESPGTGDVNQDGNVDLLDVAPFVDLLIAGDYLIEGDINQDGSVDLLDVGPFVELLSCN